jgi:hypothetical protein
MLVLQLLSSEPLTGIFFLSLSVVGGILAGLGWLLFASTASSTPDTIDRRYIYAAASILGGTDIVIAVTSPVHNLFWRLSSASSGPYGFVSVQPAIGYRLHTIFLFALFAVGTALFASTWLRQAASGYARAYTAAGSVAALSVLAGNILITIGLNFAPIAAIPLTTIGWFQATRGYPLRWLRRQFK